jgi:hypothetical protein
LYSPLGPDERSCVQVSNRLPFFKGTKDNSRITAPLLPNDRKLRTERQNAQAK